MLRDMEVCNVEEEGFSGSELLQNVPSIDNFLCDQESSTQIRSVQSDSLMLPQPVRFPVNSIQSEVNNQHGSFLAELGDCANIDTESTTTAYIRTFTSL